MNTAHVTGQSGLSATTRGLLAGIPGRDIISDAEVKAFMQAGMTAEDFEQRRPTLKSRTQGDASEAKFSPKHAAYSTPNLSAAVSNGDDAAAKAQLALSSPGCGQRMTRTRSSEVCPNEANRLQRLVNGFSPATSGRNSPGLAHRVTLSRNASTNSVSSSNGSCIRLEEVQLRGTGDMRFRDAADKDVFSSRITAHSISSESSDSSSVFPGAGAVAHQQRPYLTAPKMADFNEEDTLTEIPLEESSSDLAPESPEETPKSVPLSCDVTSLSPASHGRCPLRLPRHLRSSLSPSPSPDRSSEVEDGFQHIRLVMPCVEDGLSSGSEMDSPRPSSACRTKRYTGGERGSMQEDDTMSHTSINSSSGGEDGLLNRKLMRAITDDIRDIKRAIVENTDLPPVLRRFNSSSASTSTTSSIHHQFTDFAKSGVGASPTRHPASPGFQHHPHQQPGRVVHDLRAFTRPGDFSTTPPSTGQPSPLSPSDNQSNRQSKWTREGSSTSHSQDGDYSPSNRRGSSPTDSGNGASAHTCQLKQNRDYYSIPNGKSKDTGWRRRAVARQRSVSETDGSEYHLEAQFWTFPDAECVGYSSDECDGETLSEYSLEPVSYNRASTGSERCAGMKEQGHGSRRRRHKRRNTTTLARGQERPNPFNRKPGSSPKLVVYGVANGWERAFGRKAFQREYESDEDTEQLLNKQYNQDEPLNIPELKEQKLLSEKKKKGREVAIRHPDHPLVLIEGTLFRANYLGSTQLMSDGKPSKMTRTMQAQEAVGRIKAPLGESQPSVAVDLFVSSQKLMVLNTNLQEIMMDHPLNTISYIADIGDVLVLMARRRPTSDMPPSPGATESVEEGDMKPRQGKIICHVFESDEAQLIAQSIGHAFQMAYLEFLKANGIDDPTLFKELDYQEVLNQQEIYADELNFFANKDMQKEVIVPKQRGEPLGVVVVESGWGSMLPTVVLANMSPSGPAARCGQLNIGNQIMAINGHSLVGLPLTTCQTHIKGCKTQTSVKLTVVSCPPVVEVLINRPDCKYQLGFSVQNGVICSLLRGGIAERGGIRVGHRIIEINGQSVVAVAHEKIVNMLATAVGEIHLRTMPTSIFRLLTGQETPHYI